MGVLVIFWSYSNNHEKLSTALETNMETIIMKQEHFVHMQKAFPTTPPAIIWRCAHDNSLNSKHAN